VIIPLVKLSSFGLEDDLAVMTDCQYDGRTMCMVKNLHFIDYTTKKLSSLHIAKCCNFHRVTHFNLSGCFSLHSNHLKQLAIAFLTFRCLTWSIVILV